MPRRTTTLGRTFFAGLVAILPIAVTLSLLWWLGSSAEKLLGGLLQALLPDALYFPGLGLMVGVGLIFALGLLLRAYLVQVIFGWADSVLQRIPVVKTIYGAVQDLTQMFSGDMKNQFGQTVLVRFPGSDMRLMGFITRDDLETVDPAFCHDWPAGSQASPSPDLTVRTPSPAPADDSTSATVPVSDDLAMANAAAREALVAVYLPMSYMVGGYTVMLPASQIEPTRLSFEDAMRFALTAGVSASRKEAAESGSHIGSSER